MVLMDINMPGMSGLDALRRIRKTPTIGHTPIVMLTSLTSADTVVQALESGADDYVVKPFSAAVVQDRITKYMTKEE
jgi:DNA-binding response OmpR family regulator